MDRREALKLTTSVIAGTVIGGEFFLSGCAFDAKNEALISPEDILFLDEVGETILPETSESPGAKAAKIGAFMKTMVEDCYSPEEQQIFKKGITALQNLALKAHRAVFTELLAADKHQLLVGIDTAIAEAKGTDTPHYFTMMKQLTLWGYFTSEPGATKALRYNPVPGGYKGCVPYTEGEKAWS